MFFVPHEVSKESFLPPAADPSTGMWIRSRFQPRRGNLRILYLVQQAAQFRQDSPQNNNERRITKDQRHGKLDRYFTEYAFLHSPKKDKVSKQFESHTQVSGVLL